MKVPVYSRVEHDPVPEALIVSSVVPIVIVEGNYLFLDVGDWEGMADMFQVRIFIDTEEEDNKPGLIARHVRGGRSPEDAERHYEAVDRPNCAVVASTKGKADIIIDRRGGQGIREIGAPGQVKLRIPGQ